MGLWKSFHLILMHFFFFNFFNALRRGCIKFCWFSKIHFFYNFDRSSLFFDQSKLCLKISVSLCLVRLIEPVFQSIEHRISGFLKQFFDCFKTSFSKSSSTFLLSLTWQGSTMTFCCFLPQFLQGFPPSKPIRPFYPSFWFYFHIFMHFFMHLKGIFGPP